jgi:hypothetical protein
MPSPAGSPKIPRDVLDLLRAFCAHEVRFLVIGAHAMGYHGVPRATGDFDLLVEPEDENARRVMLALADFGAPLFDLSAEDLTKPGTVFQMGVPPYRIDLNTTITGVPFAEAWADRETTEIEHLELCFLSRAALVKNKRAVGRPKDLLDLELMGESEPPAR